MKYPGGCGRHCGGKTAQNSPGLPQSFDQVPWTYHRPAQFDQAGTHLWEDPPRDLGGAASVDAKALKGVD